MNIISTRTKSNKCCLISSDFLWEFKTLLHICISDSVKYQNIYIKYIKNKHLVIDTLDQYEQKMYV
jgi:hypothetical protein